MSARDRFFTPGSPLKGKKLPPDWYDLTDLNAKRRALVAMGYARDFEEAKSLLSRHGAAVRKNKKARAEARAKQGGKFSPED